MTEIISKVIPILLLISFGHILKRKKLINEGTINEVKKGIINVSLPALLFITFVDMKFRAEYFMLIIIMLGLLILLYLVGFGLNTFKPISHPLIPFIMTACSFGTLGIPLFSSVFGVENLDKISILGVGHEIFSWFIFFPVLKAKLSRKSSFLELMMNFIKSPLIMAVSLGIILNVLGFSIWFYENPLLNGVYVTLETIGKLTTPIILLIIGFGLNLHKRYMKQSVRFVILRMAINLIIGYMFKYAIIDKIIIGDDLFNIAYFTFLILPPPLSLPIFIEEYSTKEYGNLANNTNVLNILISIVVYILFVFMI